MQQATVSNACFLLYLFFVLDFFLRFSARIPGYGALRPTLLLFALVGGGLFLNRDKLRGRFSDPIFRAVFVLLGYILVTLPLVEWPGSVIRHHLDTFVLAIVFLFFTALIIDTDRRLRWFLFVFVACQVFRVLEPLYLNLTQGYWGSDTYLGQGQFADRLAGAPADVINPNELGFVIVTAIPFLHYLLFPLGWKSKCLYFALLPALLYALMLTMSRGAFLALLVVAFMIFKESRHKLVLIGVILALAAAGWSQMTDTQRERYLSLVDTDSEGGTSVQGRIGGMKQELRLGLERPLVGHGLGTTPEAKVHAFGSDQASHNLYAEVMIELGVVGAVLFLRFLWTIYRQLAENRRRFQRIQLSGKDLYSRLNTAMIAVFWMYAVYSVNYWGLSQYYWYLFGGLAIAFGRLLQIREEQHRQEAQPTGSGLARTGPRYPLGRRSLRINRN
ncbi:MAG: O-antigen ligase family protein [Oleiphilaceae bacterium]|nr:O-antigen ligase family protein [Oleiphilaceae bacterium]